MQSMTGYGRGEAANGAVRFTVELHSVNRKHIDIALSLPRSLQPVEGKLREKVQSCVARGRVNITVSLTAAGDAAALQVVDEELAKLYASSMRRLQAELHLEGGLTLETLLRAPGVLLSPGQDIDPEAAWPTLEKALSTALAALIEMRYAEGTALALDLKTRLERLEECVGHIQERAPQITQHYRTQLLERLKAAELEVSLTDDRLLRELALFADRSDISEELTRLKSHFAQAEKLLQSTQPVGRTLEFLTQEIAREFNTLSVKSNDAPVSHWVVEAKAELEKIREQVLNIE
jgi:uncharacterized protein (TIGR00255 family)